ncbi:hypothetical protein ACF3NG_05555 [Aerococcaceae bacterium WGS1372]
MSQTVYTNYWVNKREDFRKEHGSYPTEEEAIQGIETWWEIQKDKYTNVSKRRTNSGALEINYGDDYYFYRIEKRQINDKLPKRTYKLKTKGEIDAQRKRLNLDDQQFLFDELAEPYRDRLIIAMSNSITPREYLYSENGTPTVKIEDLKQINSK